MGRAARSDGSETDETPASIRAEPFDGDLWAALCGWHDEVFDDGSRRYLFRGQNREHFLGPCAVVNSTFARLQPDDQLLREQLRLTCRYFNRVMAEDGGYMAPTTEDGCAVMQHYGWPTPLIDFTGMPAVALFFAFLGPTDAGGRIMYVLDRESLPPRLSVASHHFLVGPYSHGPPPRWIKQDGFAVYPVDWRQPGSAEQLNLCDPSLAQCIRAFKIDNELERYAARHLLCTSLDDLRFWCRVWVGTLCREAFGAKAHPRIPELLNRLCIAPCDESRDTCEGAFPCRPLQKVEVFCTADVRHGEEFVFPRSRPAWLVDSREAGMLPRTPPPNDDLYDRAPTPYAPERSSSPRLYGQGGASAAYRWGSLLVHAVDASCLPPNDLLASVEGWGVAQELVYCMHDATTGLGFSDECTIRDALPCALTEAMGPPSWRAQRATTELQMQEHVWKVAMLYRRIRDEAEAATLRLSIAQGDGQCGTSPLSEEMMHTSRVLGAHWLSLVMAELFGRVVARSKHPEASLPSHDALQHFQGDFTQLHAWIQAFCRPWQADLAAMSPDDFPRGMAILLRQFGDLVDICCAVPTAYGDAGREQFAPAVKLARLLTALARDTSDSAKCRAALLAGECLDDTLESTLVDLCGFAYPLSRDVYAKWLTALEYRIHDHQKHFHGTCYLLQRRLSACKARLSCQTAPRIKYLDPSSAGLDPWVQIPDRAPCRWYSAVSRSFPTAREEEAEIAEMHRRSRDLQLVDLIYAGIPFVCPLAEGNQCPQQQDPCRRGITRPSEFPARPGCSVRQSCATRGIILWPRVGYPPGAVAP